MKNWFKGFDPNYYYRKKHAEICSKCLNTNHCTKDTNRALSCRVSKVYNQLKTIKK